MLTFTSYCFIFVPVLKFIKLNIVNLRCALFHLDWKCWRVASVSTQFKVNELQKRKVQRLSNSFNFTHTKTNLIESNQMNRLQNEIYRLIYYFDVVHIHLGAISLFSFFLKRNFDVLQCSTIAKQSFFPIKNINEAFLSAFSTLRKSDTRLFITITYIFYRLSFHSISIDKT